MVHKRQEAKINNPDSILRNISMYKWGFFIDYKHTNIYYKTHLLFKHNWHSPPYSTVDCPDVFMGSLVGWKENSMIDRSQDRGQEYWTRHLFELQLGRVEESGRGRSPRHVAGVAHQARGQHCTEARGQPRTGH